MAVTVASLVAKLGYDDNEFSRGIDGSESKLAKFAGGMKTALLGLAAVGAAAVGAIAASVISMEDALTPVMTLTGKGTKQFEDLSKGIEGVIRSSPKSANELGMAAYTILSAGISDTTTAVNALKDANKLALAGLGSVQESTDLITSAMNSWKKENLTSSDAAEIFFGTIAAGKTTTSDLASGFGAIAPLASALGIDLKSLMAATAALTAVGMPASQAYAGLRAAFSNILKPTKDAETAAKTLGIEFDLNALKAKGLQGFLQYVSEAADGNTQSLTDLFGSVEAMNAVLALTGPQAQAFADNFGLIDEKGKNLNQTAKDVSDTLSNRFREAKNAVLLYLNDIGIKGLDWLEDKWRAWGPKILGFLSSFRDGVKDFVKGLTGDYSLIDEVQNQMGTRSVSFWERLGTNIGNWSSNIRGYIGNIREGFQILGDVISGSGGRETQEGWRGTIEKIGLSIRDFKEWIEKEWPGVKDTFLNVFNAIKEWVQNNWPIVRDAIVTGLQFVKDKFDEIKRWVEENWPQIKSNIESACAAIGEALKALLIVVAITAATWEMYWNTFAGPILKLFGWMQPFVGQELDALRNKFKFFNDVVSGNWGAAWQDMLGAFGGFWSQAFTMAWNGIWQLGSILVGAFGAFWNWGYGLIQSLWQGVQSAWDWVLNFFRGLPGQIWGAIGNTGGWLWSVGWQLIQGMIRGIQDAAAGLARAAWNAVKNAIGSAWDAIVHGSPSKEGRKIGRNFVEGIIAGIDDMSGIAANVSANMAGAMVSASQYNYNIGGPGNVQVVMPANSNGQDVVRALRDWQRINGKIPIAVSGQV